MSVCVWSHLDSMASFPSAHHGHPPSLNSVVPWYSLCLSNRRYQKLFTQSLTAGTTPEGTCRSRSRSYLGALIFHFKGELSLSWGMNLEDD